MRAVRHMQIDEPAEHFDIRSKCRRNCADGIGGKLSIIIKTVVGLIKNFNIAVPIFIFSDCQ
jgi:hypothetical protein